MTKEYNPKLEESILAKIIQQPENFRIAEEFVEPASFGHPPYQILYRAIENLSDKDVDINPYTIANHLNSLGALNAIRGFDGSENRDNGKKYLDYLNSISEKDFKNTSMEGLGLQLQNVTARRGIMEFLLLAKEQAERGEEPDKILSYVEQESGKIALAAGTRQSSIATSKTVVKSIVEEYINAKKNGSRYVKTGLWVFDNFVGGLYPGRVYLTIGTSGSGKSLVMHNIAYNTSVIGVYDDYMKKTVLNKAGIITMEQRNEEVAKRLIRMMTGIDPLSIEEGRLTDAQIPLFEDAAKKISQSQILFDDSPSLTLPQLRSKMRKMAADGAKYVIVDQLDEVKLPYKQKSYTDNDVKSYAMKEYSREFDLGCLTAHQMRKSAGDVHRKGVTDVGLSDTNEGGEKGVDVVGTPRHDENGTYWIWLKLRQGGETNKPWRMDFDVERNMYKNWTGSDPEYIPEDMQNKSKEF